ncbi:class A beta-lactamase-related serine hydrolase [Seongchinamella unica]|uniref:Class A beta-lactamase-related serine hydrolase n=1 Tax=Seongchinamella unica TaxID=2547392 RepID=A0A4R5LRA2_9GAMM|nr:serine hydrolase [Seongchinamella unica]TDG13371.1 class A beta-lactamase-related serine hydrolase [Seongchinamella unica]
MDVNYVKGDVAPGFESVKALFTQQMCTLAEQNAQLCVYHRGKKVVDLWASATGNEDFSGDSLVNIFSSGKSLEAIAVGVLVSRGLITYDARITQYWPDFGAQGKEGVTVADLMRHEAGLANFDTPLDAEDLFTENIKENAVGRVIEQQGLSYDSGGKREYHAITRGWIINELFRRVDPEGRTIGEFLRQEISGPLGADVMVGVNEQERLRMFPVQPLGLGFQLWQSLLPRFLGRRVLHNVFQLLARIGKMIPSLIKGARRSRPPPAFREMTGLDYFNALDFGRGETSSANATCSARGLARLGAMMSAGGKLEGREFLSESAWRALHAKPVEASMGAVMPTRFTQGGVDCFQPCDPESPRLERAFNQGREGFYGWMGFGGSIFQWHPEHDISFAFVPTSLHYLDFLNERGKCYQAEVLRCVSRLKAGVV